MNFFVAALPRSRTAWLSAFLSQSGKYCHHDGFNGCHSIADYIEKIGDGGDASTGLQQYNINELYPDAPVVVIEKNERELLDCIDWANKTYGGDFTKEIRRQQILLNNINGLRIKQSHIDSNLRLIFEHLTGCQWHDKYANMKELNIQVANPHHIDMEAAHNLAIDYITNRI